MFSGVNSTFQLSLCQAGGNISSTGGLDMKIIFLLFSLIIVTSSVAFAWGTILVPMAENAK
jgi:hypothetical protein